MSQNPETNYGDYCVLTKYSEKGFRISQDLIAELIANAESSGKKPLLIVSIKKSPKEMYVMKCFLETINGS